MRQRANTKRSRNTMTKTQTPLASICTTNPQLIEAVEFGPNRGKIVASYSADKRTNERTDRRTVSKRDKVNNTVITDIQKMGTFYS